MRLSRHDTDQEITSYSLNLPKGITGQLAGIPFCPEANIVAARLNGGFNELAHPSCPAASQVGRTETGYGVGDALTYAPGRIYLAGPYQGQPLSLVTVNAATVGPFDLGTIVIRSAFSVNPHTAQLQIEAGSSDPIPHIIDGIPLHLRDVRIYMDRPNFTRNPSSCEPSQMISTITGSGASFENPADDSAVTVARHFQLLNCLELGFRPKLGIRLRGQTKRAGHPALRAVLHARPGDASMKRITVDMPHALFLAQNHIRWICTRVQFDAESARRTRSMAGRWSTPRCSTSRCGARSICAPPPQPARPGRLAAQRLDPDRPRGPHRADRQRRHPAFFDNVPDAPIEAFVMQLNGGKRGLLQLGRHLPPPADGDRSRRSARTTAARSTRPSCGASARRRSTRRASTTGAAAGIDDDSAKARALPGEVGGDAKL